MTIGYGDFELGSGEIIDGKRRAYISRFHLEPDELQYTAQNTTDGATFVKTGECTLKREGASPASNIP